MRANTLGALALLVCLLLVRWWRAEGQPGEVLRIEMTPADLNPKGFDLLFRVSAAQSGREVALGKIGLVCVDMVSRKPSPMPEAFSQRLCAD